MHATFIEKVDNTRLEMKFFIIQDQRSGGISENGQVESKTDAVLLNNRFLVRREAGCRHQPTQPHAEQPPGEDFEEAPKRLEISESESLSITVTGRVATVVGGISALVKEAVLCSF